MILLLTTIFNLMKRPITRREKDTIQGPIAKYAKGIPALVAKDFKDCTNCNLCEEICPTHAIQTNVATLKIDYGACLQCGLCVDNCPGEKLINSGFTDVYSFDRSELVLTYAKENSNPIDNIELLPSLEYKKFQDWIHNRGFNFREVCAGSNTGVEWELGACFNNLFDLESIGVRAVASPKHADILLIAGSMTDPMIKPTKLAWDTMPSPKLIVAIGTDAVISASSNPSLYPDVPGFWIAGDPPRPDTIIRGFLTLMGRSRYKFRSAFHTYLKEKNKEILK